MSSFIEKIKLFSLFSRLKENYFKKFSLFWALFRQNATILSLFIEKINYFWNNLTIFSLFIEKMCHFLFFFDKMQRFCLFFNENQRFSHYFRLFLTKYHENHLNYGHLTVPIEHFISFSRLPRSLMKLLTAPKEPYFDNFWASHGAHRKKLSLFLEMQAFLYKIKEFC